MLNADKNDNKDKDKNQLRILDYRNGKYQGTTLGLNMTRNGIGIALDHNYLLTIASWKEGNVQGQALIIFPDNTLYYGFLRNKFPFGMGCYQVSGKIQIYSFLGNGSENLFVLDDNLNNNLMLLTISNDAMQNFYLQSALYEDLLQKQDGQIKEKTQINLKAQINYRSLDQKWNTIETFFKTLLKSEMKSYKNFVKHYFNSQVKAALVKIQVTQSKQEVQFSFLNSSIICKITQNDQNLTDFRIKLMGYYNKNEHQFQICRKTNTDQLLEETINDFTIQYPFSKRSKACIKNIHQYYKKSLYFTNNYIQIDYLYRIKFIYHSIEASIGQISINKNAQKLLENTNELKKHQEKKKSVSKQHLNEEYSIQNLNKVKEDIYKAIKNKSNSRTKNISISSIHDYPQTPSISRANNINKFINKASPIRQKGDYKARANDKGILENRANTSQSKRSYVYLEEDENNKIHRLKNSPAKYNYVGDALDTRFEAKANGKSAKYKKDEKKLTSNIQNLAVLASYYEQIDNKLKKETTPIKSSHRLSNYDGITDKRSTYRYNLGEGQKKQRLQINKIQNSQSTSTRKVYKYS